MTEVLNGAPPGTKSPPTTQQELVDRLYELGFTLKFQTLNEIHLNSPSGDILHLVNPEVNNTLDVRKARIAERLEGLSYGSLFKQGPTPKGIFGKAETDSPKIAEGPIKVAMQASVDETVFNVKDQAFSTQVLYQYYLHPRTTISSGRIVELTGLIKSQVNGSCSYLVTKGMLKSPKRGEFRISKDGIEWIQKTILVATKGKDAVSEQKSSKVDAPVEHGLVGASVAPRSIRPEAVAEIEAQAARKEIKAEIVLDISMDSPMGLLMKLYPNWQSKIKSSEDLDTIADWYEETEHLISMMNS